jgi:hypothetical protein
MAIDVVLSGLNNYRVTYKVGIEDLIVFDIDVIFFNILDSIFLYAIFYISLYKIIRT